jgi:hypothetical protein
MLAEWVKLKKVGKSLDDQVWASLHDDSCRSGSARGGLFIMGRSTSSAWPVKEYVYCFARGLQTTGCLEFSCLAERIKSFSSRRTMDNGAVMADLLSPGKR